MNLQASGIAIGKAAPNFQGDAVMPNGAFKNIKLSDFQGKYLVFFYYPNDFTFVCPTEILAFSDRMSEFEQIDCQVVGASTDSKFVHLQWCSTKRKQGGLEMLNYPLLADPNGDIAKRYGIFNEDEGNTFRGLFIIDPKGVLRQITINDMPVGRSVDETLRLVQAFQFTDEHGEVCPANWKPGKKTMKPDPESAKEFFASS